MALFWDEVPLLPEGTEHGCNNLITELPHTSMV
jgi:hypothetical protein